MDILWSPWRMKYVTDASNSGACVFCTSPGQADSVANLIVHRGQKVYAILNRYPYTSGHLMIVPYNHTNQISDLSSETLKEMMLLVQKAVRILEKVYHPQGFNVGMNLGSVAGAGITSHLHMHVVPRWQGDANFMSVIGETRVLPEDLGRTYQRLSEAWQADSLNTGGNS